MDIVYAACDAGTLEMKSSANVSIMNLVDEFMRVQSPIKAMTMGSDCCSSNNYDQQ